MIRRLIILLLIVGCEETLEPEDCAGVAGGNAVEDCNEECGGTASIDDCGTCTGGTTGLEANYLMDCADTCNGNAVSDNCGICDSDNSNDCTQDECGVWGGDGLLDNCGTCDDDSSNDCVVDCAGNWGGTAIISGCDNLCNSTAVVDCAGECGGTAVVDMCEVCDSDATNDCVQDCAGNWGGTAIISGCDNLCNSTAVVDCAGECGGDGTTCFVTDIDGNVYETVQIGEQLWMAENLTVTHYNNGDEIPNITINNDWNVLFTGAYGDYDNIPSNSETYGRLYNWYTVDDSRGVCPEGFYVPSDDEWTILTDYLGDDAGGKMKSTGTIEDGDGLWYSPNEGTTNESGFTGLPAGHRKLYNGTYYGMGDGGYFWSSSEIGTNFAWYRYLYYTHSDVSQNYYDKRYGYSIRCLKD